ncbi:hypothetical protein P6B95_00010 [Streptomyces atratus]|uniref:hypothetical protein n=1 Tax=Streptomyces atratus TaxID=1893 RepID=UPI00167095B3|nr:hypothetical protein [Streptomyces atratus]WPW26025.1 hypothetical protein P6B95_00010 [Streptomyces atratus]GGT72560.1 hypothetical protein GCM10010207_83150 [Streptomyces atratus]
MSPELFRSLEYPNLPTLAEKAGKTGYIKHATAVRKAGGEGAEYPEPVQDVSGSGTALMELDLLCTKSMSENRRARSSDDHLNRIWLGERHHVPA